MIAECLSVHQHLIGLAASLDRQCYFFVRLTPTAQMKSMIATMNRVFHASCGTSESSLLKNFEGIMICISVLAARAQFLLNLNHNL